jgi:mono/diheme cytochrome c family protein
MSKCERQWSVVSGQWSVRDCNKRTALHCLLFAACCLLFSGCRQDMQDQPRYEAYEASGFFKNGMASRPLVEGTVPRGFLRADKQLFTGQINTAQANANSSTTRGQNNNANGNNSNTQGNSNNAGGNNNANMPMSIVSTQQSSSPTAQPPATVSSTAQQPAGDANDAEDFPFPVTKEVMERGQERFQIFCAMCHGFTGDGDGMIVRRGFRQPPSYHEDRLRQARVGYFFRVMTEGFGAMPSYRTQIPVQDRWAIIAYIRALQMSRMEQPAAAPTNAAPKVAPVGAANTQTGGHK